MTLDTTQRVQFAIPSPRTEITIGQFAEPRNDGNNNTTSTHCGIGVYTDADLRFNAAGAWVADGDRHSDLILQSKDQLWLQSIGHLVGLAEASVLLASPEAALVAGQGGVTILAGFRPSGLATQTESGAMPAAVTGYESTTVIPTLIWGIFDTVMAVGLTALDIFLTIGDRPANTSRLSAFDRWGIQGSLANLAGAAINIAGLSGSPHVTLPGINMFSQAGILVGSALGAVNITGVPGVLIQSTFTTQFSLIASGVRGLKSASMTSLKTVNVSALTDVTVRASNEVVLASRTSDTSLRGVTVKIGMLVPAAIMKIPTPQLPTASVKLHATNEVSLHAWGNVDVNALGKFDAKAVKSLSFDGGQKVNFKVGTFEITLDGTRTQLGSPPGAKIKIEGSKGPKKVLITGPGDVAKVSVTGLKVELVAGAGSCKFDVPGKKLTIDGTTLDIK